jgi:CubicO group peptidase (beta-lactamase class C family)
MKFLWLLLLLSWFPTLSAGTDSARAATTNVRVRELGRDWLERNGGVGLSIGVYDKGDRQFYNFGVTRLDAGTAPTKDTVYEIGALAKTMTAQILARAVVEGRASLNDEASKYLEGAYPNLANSGENIRLVHLANMTSQLWTTSRICRRCGRCRASRRAPRTCAWSANTRRRNSCAS